MYTTKVLTLMAAELRAGLVEYCEAVQIAGLLRGKREQAAKRIKSLRRLLEEEGVRLPAQGDFGQAS